MRLITTKVPAPVAGVPELERFIDRFFGVPHFQNVLPPLETAWVPPLDYVETEKAFIVRLEVPGIPKENLDINLDGLILTITGHREVVKEYENENIIANERMMGRFVRALRLPMPVLEDKIEATVHDGVMVITLPKTTVVPKSRITIK
ncbi:MAG TPA: Hsp20/alpha crystallin family protein [Gemmatimonadales bacterium]|nr:Hsp20/alpha crystallin family protein [Gemmatimonadales bacterium]